MIDIRLPLQTILAGIALLLFSSCGDTNAGDGKEEVATTDPPVPVRLEEVTPRSFTETIQLTAVVKA
ncbi:MAG: hypothetical protein OEM41_09985, partial [Ignavibacteria bacterium]|nr:hypothetical protein [Ignavibacteria bacterium]